MVLPWHDVSGLRRDVMWQVCLGVMWQVCLGVMLQHVWWLTETEGGGGGVLLLILCPLLGIILPSCTLAKQKTKWWKLIQNCGLRILISWLWLSESFVAITAWTCMRTQKGPSAGLVTGGGLVKTRATSPTWRHGCRVAEYSTFCFSAYNITNSVYEQLEHIM